MSFGNRDLVDWKKVAEDNCYTSGPEVSGGVTFFKTRQDPRSR